MTEGRTILVVDDTPQNVLLLEAFLTGKGYKVITASSGSEALRLIESAVPDLVLLDVVMAGMSGYEVCQRIRAHPHTEILPVVLVTALDPAQERIKGLEAGADDFLSKPINQPELLARVRTLLRIKELYDTVQAQASQLAELNGTLEQRVAELRAAYRDLQTTQMQLIQREKMASVGQLVAGVAHELNNPIGFVYSNVTTLEDFVKRLRGMLEVYQSVPLPQETRDQVDAEWERRKIDYALRYMDSMTQGIREGAERARKIVRDLRVFAHSQDDVWQPVDLHEEIESSLTLLNHLLKDRVTVHRKFGELPHVDCIRSGIDQVFLNLLANAAQAIEGPGTITIETRGENDMAVVSIADTGPGIAPDVASRIFDPFFTTKPVGEGTGLGLSISYEIVKKHGGTILAKSPAGGGAVFTVRLPIARATTA